MDLIDIILGRLDTLEAEVKALREQLNGVGEVARAADSRARMFSEPIGGVGNQPQLSKAEQRRQAREVETVATGDAPKGDTEGSGDSSSTA